MIGAIEDRRARVYAAAMRSAVLRLLALVAVLLMPLGMSAAPAAAQHEQAAMSMPMQHCPDAGSKPHASGAVAECTMACSAALPAVDFGIQEPPRILCAPVRPSVTQVLHGLHPDIATPPPKSS